jgi:hypothetical protein
MLGYVVLITNNPIAYYTTELITTVKRFYRIGQKFYTLANYDKATVTAVKSLKIPLPRQIS